MQVLKLLRAIKKELVALSGHLLDQLALHITRGPVLNNYDLIIVKTDGVGDVILWSGVLKAITDLQKSTACRILLVTTDHVAPLVSEYFPEVTVFKIDKNRFRRPSTYRWKLVQTFRRIQARTLLNAVIARDPSVDDPISEAFQSANKIAATGDKSNASVVTSQLKERIYSVLVSDIARYPSELQKAVHLASSAFHISKAVALPKLNPAKTDFPQKVGRVGPTGDYAVVFPGASSIKKRWPAERFAEVAQFILSHLRMEVIICGDAGDQIEGNLISRRVPNSVNLVGRTSLPQLVEIIRRARLVISNDTSASHIAAATGTACVTILGGGHYGRFLPYPSQLKSRHISLAFPMECFGCNWQCTKRIARTGCVDCIDRISTGEVITAIRDQITPEQTSAKA